jgi:hypothetical protein
MDVQQGLAKLKRFQDLRAEIAKAADSYQSVARALSDPLGTRIEGYRAPVGYGDKSNLTERPQALDELKELLFELQSVHSDLEANAPTIPDDNVQATISRELSTVRW